MGLVMSQTIFQNWVDILVHCTSMTAIMLLLWGFFLGLLDSSILLILTLYHKIPTFNNPNEEGFGKLCGKRRKCWYRHFLLFSQCFLLYHKEKSSFQQHLICCLQMLSIWSCPKFCRLVKS